MADTLGTVSSLFGGGGGGGGGGMGYSVNTNATSGTGDVRFGSSSQAGFNFGGINNGARIPSWIFPVGVAAVVLLGGLFIWRRYK